MLRCITLINRLCKRSVRKPKNIVLQKYLKSEWGKKTTLSVVRKTILFNPYETQQNHDLSDSEIHISNQTKRLLKLYNSILPVNSYERKGLLNHYPTENDEHHGD